MFTGKKEMITISFGTRNFLFCLWGVKKIERGIRREIREEGRRWVRKCW